MRAQSKDKTLYANLQKDGKLSLLDVNKGKKLFEVNVSQLGECSRVRFSEKTYRVLLYPKDGGLFAFNLETKKIEKIEEEEEKEEKVETAIKEEKEEELQEKKNNKKLAKEEGKSNSSLERWANHLLVIGISLMVGSGVGLYHVFQEQQAVSQDAYAKMAMGSNGVLQVPVVEWDQAVLEDVIKAGIPIVFTKTPAMEWDAMEKWSPVYLMSKTDDIARIQVSNDPSCDTYAYDVRSAPLLPLLKKEEYDPGFQPQNMTSEEFFTAMFNGSDPRWVYYAGNLVKRDGTKPAVLNDLGNPETLGLMKTVRKLGLQGAKETASETMFVWMGKPGVKAHAHYDHAHNLFIQFSGYKRWILYPPEVHDQLHPYPRLHPRRGQTIIDLEKNRVHASVIEAASQSGKESLSEATIPREAVAKMRHVVVEPGDILYVPPLWTHHVTAFDSAMGPPVSLSLWVESLSSDVSSRVAERKIPIGLKWPLYLRWSASYAYLLTIFSSLKLDGSASECKQRLVDGVTPTLTKECVDEAALLLKRMAETRYGHIMPPGPASEGTKRYVCSAQQGEGFVLVEPQGEVWEDFIKMDADSLAKVKSGSVEIVRMLHELRPSEKLIVAFDYAEELLLTAVGLSNLYDSLKAIPIDCTVANITKTHAIPPSA